MLIINIDKKKKELRFDFIYSEQKIIGFQGFKQFILFKPNSIVLVFKT